MQIFKNIKYAIVLFLMTGLTFTAYSQEVEKTISKNYSISQGFMLGVDNEYGEINLVNWNKDELSVAVTITVKAGSHSEAEKLLGKIDIEIDKSKTSVNFKTEIEDISASKAIEIVYDIKAPSYIQVSLDQSYGSIFVQELTAPAEFKLKYGELIVNALKYAGNDKRNTLEMAYSEATFDYTSNLEAEVKYSELNVDASESLSIESAYSKFSLGTITDLSMESKYDKVSIEKLYGLMNLNSAYTQVIVDYISRDFSGINAGMKYGNLKGNLEENTSFNIDADVAFGTIKIPDGDYNFTKENTSQKAHGTVGSNATAKVFADIRYGNLTLD